MRHLLTALCLTCVVMSASPPWPLPPICSQMPCGATICSAATKMEFLPRQKQEQTFTYDYFVVHMPTNQIVAEKITAHILAAVHEAEQDYMLSRQKGERLTSHLTLTVSYQGERYLSLKRKNYCYYKGAAHPNTLLTGKTYDLATGEVVPWQRLIRPEQQKAFTLAKINQKLFAPNAPWRGGLYNDFKGLTSLPEDYYLDSLGHIHFIFQQYEIAPYATGIIDVDMQKGCE